MPVYNADRYLTAALESVLTQTFADFECICVDDGSTDGSLDVLRSYECRDLRIRVISRPNTGIVGALNDGLALARTDLIARMDADDVSKPERFARQVAFMEDHLDCVVVGTQVEFIDADGDVLGPMQPPPPPAHELIDAELLRGNGWALLHPTTMMRREAVLKVGAYRPHTQWVEDVDLFLRMAEVGRLANLPEILFSYRQLPSSVCLTRRDRQIQLLSGVLGEAMSRRGLEQSNLQVAHALQPVGLADCERYWARIALANGNLATARKHAWRAVRHKPFSRKTWRILRRTSRSASSSPFWKLVGYWD